VLRQLAREGRLDDPAGELGDQPARTGDLLRPEPFQRVLKRVRRQQLRQPIEHLFRSTLFRAGPGDTHPHHLDLLA